MSLSTFPPLETFRWVGWAWWLLLPLGLPWGRGPAGYALLALALRLIFDPDRLLLGGGYPYNRLHEAWGVNLPHPFYGDGWPALQAPAWDLLGQPADSARTVNLVLSSLAPAWLYALLRHLDAPVTVRRLAPLLLCVLPLAVALARTESHLVAVATLQVAACASVLDRRRVRVLFGVVSAGMLAHLRPEEGLFALLPVALAFRRGHRAAAALGAGLVAWRAAQIVAAPHQPGTTWLPGWTTHALQLLPGPGGGLALFDPTLTPAVLPVLLLLGLPAVRHRHDARLALLAAATTALPVWNMELRTDILRFQLPTMTWWCVLAAYGVVQLVAAGRWATLALLLVAPLTVWWARNPIGPVSIWTWEHRLLHEAAPLLHPGDVVRYDAVWDTSRDFRAVATSITGALFVPLEDRPVVAGEWLWTGRGSAWPGAAPPPACTMDVVLAHTVPVATYHLETIAQPELTLSLAKVVSCP